MVRKHLVLDATGHLTRLASGRLALQKVISSCPCTETPWPSGVSWPCSGLLENYAMDNGFQSLENDDAADIFYARYDYANTDCTGALTDGYERRFTSPVTLTADTGPGSGCFWNVYITSGSGLLQRRVYSGSSWGSWTNRALGFNLAGFWEITDTVGGTDGLSAERPCSDPVGLYKNDEWGECQYPPNKRVKYVAIELT